MDGGWADWARLVPMCADRDVSGGAGRPREGERRPNGRDGGGMSGGGDGVEKKA